MWIAVITIFVIAANVAAVIMVPFIIVEAAIPRLVAVVVRMGMQICMAVNAVAIQVVMITVVGVEAGTVAWCRSSWKCSTAGTRVSRMIRIHHIELCKHTISPNGLLILCQPPFDFLDKCFTFYPYTFLLLLIVLWFWFDFTILMCL